MNSRAKVIERNKKFLKECFGWTEENWLNFMHEVGPPLNKYGINPDPANPTKGWCGGVTRALRLSGKVPEGYISCRQKNDPHYYLINPISQEVIDLTIYQMKEDYEHDYTDYKRTFMNVLSNSVSMLMKRLDLKIDTSKFCIVKKKQSFIRKAQ